MKRLIFIALLPLMMMAGCENGTGNIETKTLAGNKWTWTKSVAPLEPEYGGHITPDSAGITCSLYMNDDGTYSAELTGDIASAREYHPYWSNTLKGLLVDGEVRAEGTYTTGSALCDTNRCKIHLDNPAAYTVDSIVFYNTALNDTSVYFYEIQNGELNMTTCYHSAVGCFHHCFEVF